MTSKPAGHSPTNGRHPAAAASVPSAMAPYGRSAAPADGSAERIFQVSSQDSFWKTRGQTRPAGQQQVSLRTLLEQKNGQQGNHQTNGQPSSDMLGLLGAMGMFGSFGSFGSLGSLGSSGSLGAGGLGQFFEYLMWK